ncbi:1,25-dihydroxyvitamin D(3) 24-hydroxylase, mitochondrial-like [Haliotis rubra]|uniref:1,25-dihydroxyvitamin D(3) 24-hydroxylase, mitochondrial-like n=1 Tax=Haliotis rubra TaxID=36100 RepID=UPI001EE5C93B|nr:1,25-dihydroxyvitamin D(3) 24-hydroxylase, mitochondrial-like [Haliotis rubra]
MTHAITRACYSQARRACVGCVRFRYSTEVGKGRDDFASAKPFNDIPFKKGYPVINNMLEFAGKYGKMHELIWSRHQQLGPIFREKLGVLDSVMITDVEAIGDFLRQEGKYPMRTKVPVWSQYRKQAGEAEGIFIADSEDWQRMRSVVDKPLLKIKTVESYADTFNIITTEFLDRLARLRGPDGVVENIDVELFNWSLENPFFLRREYYPPTLAKIFRPLRYRAFTRSTDTLFRVARQCVDEALVELKSKTVSEEEVGFLEYLLLKDTISKKEIYANVTELMSAAVDTTSNTVQFMLYEVAKNPDVQKKLREELERSVPPGEIPTPVHLRNMPYLKAVIKETLRLYPVGSYVGRINQHDIVILGYQVPKGKNVVVSLHAVGRSPSLYDEADTFRPERWMREMREASDKPAAFSHIPFGFGQRMCVGRRVAELEMQLLMAQMLQRFDLKPSGQPPPDIVQFVITRPKDPVRVKLVDRPSR